MNNKYIQLENKIKFDDINIELKKQRFKLNLIDAISYLLYFLHHQFLRSFLNIPLIATSTITSSGRVASTTSTPKYTSYNPMCNRRTWK